MRVNARDDKDRTPLHTAALWHRSDVVGVLLAKGADINAREQQGLTPFFLAHRVEQWPSHGESRANTISLLESAGGTLDEETMAKIFSGEIENVQVQVMPR